MPPEYFFENKEPKLECGSRSFFLFLDFDGTLVPIQNDPTKCVLSSEIKGQLEAIALSGKACIAILSGRTVTDIRDRVNIQDVYYGGNHGIEISGPRVNYTHPDALSGKHVIEKVCSEIEKEIGHIEGALIEKKKFGFTLHYRMADKESKALIKNFFTISFLKAQILKPFLYCEARKFSNWSLGFNGTKERLPCFSCRVKRKTIFPYMSEMT